jgi:S1-C subfamily serine protease
MKTLSISLLLIAAAGCFIGQAHAQQLREMFSKTNPSVVVIRTVERRVAPQTQGLVSLPGLGSGVVISNDGKILTAAHVVQAADQVSVEFADGKQERAHVSASYPRADIAIVQLDFPPAGLIPAKLGNSDAVQVGDDVFVIGAPYGLSHSLTVGHISGKHLSKESIAGVSKVEVFQTDAAINQGNSGGPMFNMAGEVIGIVSQILTTSGGFQGLGFAVTSNVASKLLLNKKSFWTGIDGYLLTNELARIFNVPQPAGLLVQRAADNSPASDLRLIPGTMPTNIGGADLVVGGDIILEVAGIRIVEDWRTLDEIQTALGNLQTGEKYSLKVLRGGAVVELSAYVRAKQ